MALSVVNFRMHHGTAMEQITFTGNGIKLLDLKKEILDKKEISKSLDFDLKIVDENGKVYTEDGEVVPKNSSIVVRRVPSRNSLVSRLNSRGMMHGHAAAAISAQPRGEIVMPMKVEIEEDSPNPDPSPAGTQQQQQPGVVSTVSPLPGSTTAGAASSTEQQESSTAMAAEDEADVLKLLEEEETVLKPTIPVNAPTLNSLNNNVFNNTSADPRYNNNNRMGRGNNSIKPSISSGNYTCNRCQRTGHIAKNCPTLGDASYDPEIRLMNVPRTGRKRVTTLNNIDTSMYTVIPLNDGSYEIFESSARGLEKLTKEGGSHAAANIDMNTVPELLKCPLSNTLLREAVTLPCCQKSVNDSVIRLRLVSSGLVCPLCSTPSVSPESLIIRKDIREQVDSFLASHRKAEESPALGGLNSTAAAPAAVPAFPTFSPPIPTGPPPPQPPGIAPTGIPPGVAPGMFPGAGMMPMGMGGMMMQNVPGMYPGMGMGFPPGFHDNPPIHALPLPLSKEQFLYEQRLQIMLLKEMHGGVLPRHAGGAGRGSGGGRGFPRGGRGGGHRGGAPEREAGPGRFPYGPADDRYQPKVRESEERYEPKVREPDLSRYQPKVRSEEEMNSAKRRRDEPVSGARASSRDSRRRSSSRDRERRDESRRPSDRAEKRDWDSHSMSRRREESRMRGSSRDRERSRRPSGPEDNKGTSGREKDRARRDASPSERDSKRRRQEESSAAGRETERRREREKERDQGRSGSRREEGDRKGGAQKPVDDRGKSRRDEPIGAGRGSDARDRDGKDRRHGSTNEAPTSRATSTSGKEFDDRKDRDAKRRGDSRSRGPPERARESSGRSAEERPKPSNGGGDRGNGGRDGSGGVREGNKPAAAEAQQVVLQEKTGGGGGGRNRRGRGRDRKRNRAGSRTAAD